MGPEWTKSLGESEDDLDEVKLARDITLCQPSNLPFADHVHRFIALDRPLGARKRAEAQTRVDPPFDRTMILLDNIVEIGNDTAATSPAERVIPFQFVNHSGIGVTVHIDHTWA